MKKMKIYFGLPLIGEKEIKAVIKVLNSGWLGFGKISKDFECKTAEYVRAKNAISVSSCTAALHLSLIISGVKRGDEVITTPLTFIATIRAIELVGAIPVLVDVNKETLNIDTTKIEEKITSKTKAILPVHFGGMPCDLKEIYKIAKKYDLRVVEDAAHALGSEYGKKKIGGFDESITCFSFYPNKNITSIEGGMLTFKNSKHLVKLDRLRMSGMSSGAWNRFSKDKKYSLPEVVDEGFKYNLNDVNSAIGLVQLSKLENFINIKSKQASIYDKYFKNKGFIITQKRSYDESTKIRHSFHLYTITLNQELFRKNRDEVLNEIRDAGIGVVVHYKPVHKMPYFINKYGRITNLDNSDYIGDNIMSLPIGAKFSLKDIEFAAKKILLILEKNLL